MGNTYELWDMIIKTATTSIAIVAAIAGTIRYFQEKRYELEIRRQELAWRKTEFVFKLSESFDRDQNIQKALKLIEFGTSTDYARLAEVLRQPVNALTPENLTLRYQVDRYLDFFDRIYQYVCVTKTLTPQDTMCFTWYIRRIGQVPVLAKYVRENGYEDLLTLHEVFKPYFQSPEAGVLSRV